METKPILTVFKMAGRVAGGMRLLLAVTCLLWAGKAATAAEPVDYAAQITSAPLFLQPLVWVGTNPPDANESYELYRAGGLDGSVHGQEVIAALDNFAKVHDSSPWTPSLEANLARYYRSQGRYSLALDNWQKAWQATQDLTDPNARMVADYTLAYWSELLASLGRVDELQKLIVKANRRHFNNREFQKQFDLARQAAVTMKAEPGASYRCGSLALYHVARALNLETNVQELLQMDSPNTGFSLSQLTALSAKYKLGLVAVKRPAGDRLVVPSVVHWNETHYAAIVSVRDGAYQVIDPTFGRSQWLTAKVINENASGYFMVPSKLVPTGWQLVSTNEAKTIFGKGLYCGWFIDPTGPPCDGSDPCTSGTCSVPCAPGGDGSGAGGPDGSNDPDGSNKHKLSKASCSSCSGGRSGSEGVGMPYWEVQEPYISLWLHDRPMAYNMSFGRQFALQVDYHQRETRPSTLGAYSLLNFGPDWNCNLLTYIKVDGTVTHDWGEYTSYDPMTGLPVTNILQVTSGDIQSTEYCPDGGEQTFTWDGTNYSNFLNPRTLTQFKPSMIYTQMTSVVNFGGLWYTNSADHYMSNTLAYANGSTATFGLIFTVSTFPEQKIALLTSSTDPQGHMMRYLYSISGGRILLSQIVDYDGKTNNFVYGNATFPTAVTQITNTAYGLGVNFKYDAGGYLTNIVDVAGISSSFAYSNIQDVVWQYDDYGVAQPVLTNSVVLLNKLHTPYGDTTFDFFHPTWSSFTGSDYTNSIIDNAFDGINYAITVTQPDGGKHLFMYRDNLGYYIESDPGWSTCRGVNDDYDANLDQYGIQSGTYETFHCNSYYYGPRQYANLSTTTLTNLDSDDFFNARTRVWNWDCSEEDGVLRPSQSLMVQQEFAPDIADSRFGMTTWYGYQNRKDLLGDGQNFGPYSVSTNDWLPSSIGYHIDSASSMHYENIERNSLGRQTKVVEFGSDDNCNILIRTNLYNYALNDMDLLQHTGPDGVVEEAYSYDSHHNVLSMTNALHEVTRYTYNGNGQVTSITQPNGLQTTNIYGSNGFLAQSIVVGFSTNSYTYTNGLVYTHTDERGLTTTNTWDALQRLTKVSYPDGTYVSYVYSNLSLVKVVDRMGYTTGYTYDNMQRRTAMTNALTNVTYYSYCTCGSLESIRDAAGNFTYFYYDQAGQLTNTVYADGYSVGRVYNMMGKIINTTDSSGNSINRYYDGFTRLTAMANTVGGMLTNLYNVNDLITNHVDADGVSVNMTYDDLHRLRTRSYPDGGVEKYGYSANVSGPVAYTNQVGNVVFYGYDTLNRKTNEIYVGVTTNKFGYNGAGDLLALTDGKSQVTTWGYDIFGRVTNKVDAASNLLFVYKYDPDNRLTNRWSATKGGTGYSYDAIGNLTKVDYPASPDITLKYDVLNRLTNMVDAVGTTVYGYDPAGLLLSEDGPWSSDAVNFTYQHRLRTGLSIQAPNASAWTQSYVFDPMRRLLSLTSPAGTFAYNYGWDGVSYPYWYNWQIGYGESVEESYPGKRVFGLTLPNGAYITNSFDNVARLTSTALMTREVGWVWDPTIGDNVFIGSSNLDSYAYAYNQANQRTSVTRMAGDYVNYTYDNMGELKTAIGKEAGGVTNRWQEQLGYAYDAAGNLNTRTNNALLQTFNVNNLNGLTTVGTSGKLTVAGSTTSPATNVTVNTSNAVLYADVAFASTNQPWSVGNNTYTAIAKDAYGRKDTNSITVAVRSSTAYTYDLNGNMLSDGTRGFDYDDENQLIRVTLTNTWKSEFTYDGKMRRRITKEFVWNGSAWAQTNEIHYVYDGNLVVQERDANNVPIVTYTRGNDLSGTLQGAGGIGGLLARTDNSKLLISDALATAFYHADGNGNVICLIYTNQTIAAKYLYDPFGNMLSMYGSLADANSYRFSSKEWNANSGLYYYLYRFYDANLQRWLNKDPIQEWGGWNLYSYIKNSTPNDIDYWGTDLGNGHSNDPIIYFPPKSPNPAPPVTSPMVSFTACILKCLGLRGKDIASLAAMVPLLPEDAELFAIKSGNTARQVKNCYNNCNDNMRPPPLQCWGFIGTPGQGTSGFDPTPKPPGHYGNF